MIGTIQRQLSGLIRPGLAGRGVALFACALVMCGVGARPVVAQSSKMHAAFADADINNSAAS